MADPAVHYLVSKLTFFFIPDSLAYSKPQNGGEIFPPLIHTDKKIVPRILGIGVVLLQKFICIFFTNFTNSDSDALTFSKP